MAMGVRDLTQIWKGMDSRLRGNDFGTDQFDCAQAMDPRLCGDDR